MRDKLFKELRTQPRQKNRRALLFVYKHLDKAARILGAPRQEIPKRKGSDAQPQYSPQERTEQVETGVILANNQDEPTGREKPVKAKRK